MKLNLNTDFTKFPRVVSVLSAGAAGTTLPSGRAILAHDERHLRRRAIELADGSKVLVDLPEPVALN
ncbi:urease accessory protein UreE, partial [Mesorhizobium sp. M7A.F.Ca.AU.001.01.1.1]